MTAHTVKQMEIIQVIEDRAPFCSDFFGVVPKMKKMKRKKANLINIVRSLNKMREWLTGYNMDVPKLPFNQK